MNQNQNYLLRKHKLGDNLCFDIEQENLVYSDSVSHHGLQCNHVGGTKKHKEIMKLCEGVVFLIKKIDALNSEPGERVSLDETMRMAKEMIDGTAKKN